MKIAMKHPPFGTYVCDFFQPPSKQNLKILEPDKPFTSHCYIEKPIAWDAFYPPQ